MNTYDFSDKVALVTGAGSGIGEACALAFAAGGAAVVVSDLDEQGGQRVVKAVEDAGGRASFIHTDVADAEAVEATVAYTLETFGNLDIAVNNAGIGGEISPVGEYSPESWRKVIDINLNGVFYGLRYQIPAMLQNGGGVIINMASILGSVGTANSGAYVAAKHGVVGLTKSAALEVSAQGIRVNSVGPGYIKTPLLEALGEEVLDALTGQHPIGRLGESAEVARLVAFLCSDDASFITGGYYTVDGAYTAQ